VSPSRVGKTAEVRRLKEEAAGKRRLHAEEKRVLRSIVDEREQLRSEVIDGSYMRKATHIAADAEVTQAARERFEALGKLLVISNSKYLELQRQYQVLERQAAGLLAALQAMHRTGV
jgi:hypothetical protein